MLMKKTCSDTLKNDIYRYLDENIRQALSGLNDEFLNQIEEIRLRAGKPLMVNNHLGDWFLGTDGKRLRNPDFAQIVDQNSIIRTVEKMSENSIYAYQDEIKNGFITLKGGHRVGISGKVVLENGQVKNIRDISGLNIRIARQIPGCSQHLLKYLRDGEGRALNILIVSPPQCGKTTILRDIARVISNGSGEYGIMPHKVGIIDERSEIASCYRGIPQNDVGFRTDVLDNCPKQLGLVMLLRSMSPQVLITDEIGNDGDREALMQVFNSGVKIIATAHGYGISDLKSRKEVLQLLEEKVFDRVLVLSKENGPGTLKEVINGHKMEVLYKYAVESAG